MAHQLRRVLFSVLSVAILAGAFLPETALALPRERSSPILLSGAKPATTTTLFSGTNPSAVGSSVTFVATVTATSPATGVPTGPVTFYGNGVPINRCRDRILSSGTTTCTLIAPPAGTSSITAVFASTANYRASTSPTITQTVGSSATRTDLTPIDSPVTIGTGLRFRVTVTPVDGGEGTPTGIVALYRVRANDSREWIGRQKLRGGTGTITVATMTIGLHTVVAEYRGTLYFGTSHRSARQRIDR